MWTTLMHKKHGRMAQLAASVRKDFPDITWVSARITGCKLILDIKEKEELQETEKNSSRYFRTDC